MSRPQILPDDVRKTCIQLARGYERRVREYHLRRMQIIEATPCNHTVIKDPADPEDWKKTTWAYLPSAHSASRTGENIAEQLLALEEQPETKRMRAVEQAKLRIGLELPEDMRRKLANAVFINCQSGRKYPFKVLDVEGLSERGFYRAREAFLMDIAIFLEML